jgi:hypothetical protein
VEGVKGTREVVLMPVMLEMWKSDPDRNSLGLGPGVLGVVASLLVV